MTVRVGEAPLRREQVVAVARHFEPVEVSTSARERLSERRHIVDALVASGEPVYRVSPGLRPPAISSPTRACISARNVAAVSAPRSCTWIRCRL